ncbi:Alpha-(1,3)-fucosyltransferase 4 [Holothuria leucospilota]|uniref:Fucosyltransferase n=1 Tax=Holothuria leucospilota TaxID=206669 RepID=A0A9Q1H1A0_HOLLE|nr:Alpha-(1,3)-fucosyltransferase 4 [Holothuria leucospilota]
MNFADKRRKSSTNSSRHVFRIAHFQPVSLIFPLDKTEFSCGSDATIQISISVTTADVVNDANVLVLGYKGTNSTHWGKLHKNRNYNQIWLMSTGESALSRVSVLPPLKYRYTSYNWSFYYHSKADISVPFGLYVPSANSELQPTSPAEGKRNFLQYKTKLVAWMSSGHCDGLSWDRTQFVRDLANIIPVDTFGKCGSHDCPKEPVEDCVNILRRYKFYLALENNCCSEYITEKFWRSLQVYEAIPIVIGATKREYQRLAPPLSFIHADDFDSMARLAEFIQSVASNVTLYNSFFKWKTHGQIKLSSPSERKPLFQDGACALYHYYQEHLSDEKTKRHYFDPYGSSWLANCFQCGERNWIKSYIFDQNLEAFEKKIGSSNIKE